MSQLTSEAKAKLAATIRTLRQRLLSDLSNGAESAYRLSISAIAQAGLAEAQRRKRQRLEGWLAEQGRADLTGQPIKDRSGAAAASRQRHLQEAIKLAGATLLNRLVVIKQLEAQGLIKPAVVTGGWNSPGYREFREFATDLCKDETEGYGLLLKLLYDELALELPGLFGRVGLTELFPVPASTLRAVVEALNDPGLETAWRDDTTLGWVYQYWNDPEREALDAKLNGGGKVEPHEVASKTQMFTERYMVEWLLQNSLGQQWLAICQGNGWVPEAVADGTLARLEERRRVWRQRRAAGEVTLDALMPVETEQEERWKYWVPPALQRPPESGSTPLSLGRGAGGEGQSSQAEDYAKLAGRNRQIPRVLLEKAKRLRQEQTSAENLLWECLRNRQLNDAKFRRQHNIGQIIADFYCHEAKLIIELDGSIHDQRRAEDRIRDDWATSNGIRVVRFSNNRVFADLEGVLGEIAERLSPHPPNPLLPEEKGAPESGSTPLSPGRGAGGEGPTVQRSLRHIKIFDPACGSGHFLVIAFDLLRAFYQEEARHRGESWSDQEIVESILENNLYGLDLDPRAVQIAAAALYLKAKAVCRRARPGRLNLVASNLNLAALPQDDPARQELRRQVYETTGIPEALTNQIMEALQGADQWGSLLKVDRAVEAAIAAYERSLEKGVQMALLPPLPGGEGEQDSDLLSVWGKDGASTPAPLSSGRGPGVSWG